MEKAHKTLVHKYLYSEPGKKKVEERLSKYESIGGIYKYDDLMKWSETPPYYCHYLAWRLATWEDEKWLKYFNDLLKNAVSLKGWNNAKNEQSFAEDCGFDVFWQLLWELQVAEFFVNIGWQVEWVNSKKAAPDLKIISQSKEFYVECTVYTKSFGTISFIQELCKRINSKIKVDHIPCTPLGLGKYQKSPDKLDTLLDKIFRSVIEAKEQPESQILFSDPEVPNFRIYLRGTDPFARPLIDAASPGDPADTLQNAIKEAIRMKIKKTGELGNGLSEYHPHLVAINLLLSGDSQTAIGIYETSKQEIILSPEIVVDWNRFDCVFLAHCGIDESLSQSIGRLYVKNDHQCLVSFLDRVCAVFDDLHNQEPKAT